MKTAEQLLEQLLTYHMNHGEKVALIRQAMDQSKLVGIRMGLEAAAQRLDDANGYEPPEYVGPNGIRAISPETVMKGDE